MPGSDVDEIAAEFAREHGVAGLAIGIVRDRRLAHAVCIGEASISAHRPVTPKSVFRAGSISKIFTGIAIMQLAADGRVDLEGHVNSYLREFSIDVPVGAPPVTIRHLLTHTSGIGELRRCSDAVRRHIGMSTAPDRPIPTLGQYYARGLRTAVPAGTRWAYANHGFATLGAVVESVTGERYDDYMRRAILDPLGMAASDFCRSDRVSGQLCDGHSRLRGTNRPVRYMDIIPGPAGSLFTNVDDMALVIAALCEGDSEILDGSSLAEMMKPQFRIDPRLPAMGLAFFLGDLDGHRVVSHDGGVDGFISHLRVAPDDGAGVIVFTNSASTKISLAIDRLGEDLLRATLQLERPVRGRTDPATGASRPDLLGSYRLRPGLNTNARPWMFLGGEVEVMVDDGRLALRSFLGPARTPTRLRRVDGDDHDAFEVDIESITLDVAFSEDLIHLGPPLNTTLVRRTDSFRQRIRIAVGGVATVFAAVCVVAHRRRRAP